MYYPLYERQIMMVGRVGFEPTVLSRDAIMSRGPATNTASGPSCLNYTWVQFICQRVIFDKSENLDLTI